MREHSNIFRKASQMVSLSFVTYAALTRAMGFVPMKFCWPLWACCFLLQCITTRNRKGNKWKNPLFVLFGLA